MKENLIFKITHVCTRTCITQWQYVLPVCLFFFFIEFERMMQKNFDEEKGDMEEV